MMRGPWHFSWTVADLERSLRFYTELIGLEVVAHQEQANAYTERLVGIPGAHLKVAMLAFPGVDPGISGHVLELVEYVAPAGAAVDLATPNVGIAHFAICTDSIHADVERLRDHGVTIRSPDAPVAITAGRNAGGFACYLQDPDGFTLELLQPPAERLRG